MAGLSVFFGLAALPRLGRPADLAAEATVAGATLEARDWPVLGSTTISIFMGRSKCEAIGDRNGMEKRGSGISLVGSSSDRDRHQDQGKGQEARHAIVTKQNRCFVSDRCWVKPTMADCNCWCQNPEKRSEEISSFHSTPSRSNTSNPRHSLLLCRIRLHGLPSRVPEKLVLDPR